MLKKVLPAGRQGFTLVELLVVIAILGIIAIGLIIAIDPVEQVNRASDAARRSLSTDIMNAFNRFYASKNYSAACPDSTCATYNDSLSATTPVLVSTITTTNTGLNTAGETKSATSYTGHPQAGKVSASLANTTTAIQATIVLCWQPQSKAQKSNSSLTDPNSTIYTDNKGTIATVQSACPASNANTCYQCVKQ